MLSRDLKLVTRLLNVTCAKSNMVARTSSFPLLSVLCLCTSFSTIFTLEDNELKDFETIAIEDVEEITKEACILAFVPFLTDLSVSKQLKKFRKMKVAFEKEPLVLTAILRPNYEDNSYLLKTIHWKGQHPDIDNSIILFPRRRLDRICLTPKPKFVPAGETLDGNMNDHLLLAYINSKCQTFRTLDGNLTKQGQKRENILKNLYHLPRKPPFPEISSACERIKMPRKEEFINKFLYRSRPVIIEGGFILFACMLGNGQGVFLLG